MGVVLFFLSYSSHFYFHIQFSDKRKGALRSKGLQILDILPHRRLVSRPCTIVFDLPPHFFMIQVACCLLSGPLLLYFCILLARWEGGESYNLLVLHFVGGGWDAEVESCEWRMGRGITAKGGVGGWRIPGIST